MDRIETINKMLKLTLRYHLGELLIASRSSAKGILSLPWQFYKLHKAYSQTVTMLKDDDGLDFATTSEQSKLQDPSFIICCQLLSQEELTKEYINKVLNHHAKDDRMKAESLLRTGMIMAAASVPETVLLAEMALYYSQNLSLKQEVILLLHRVGQIFKAVELLDEIQPLKDQFSSSFKKREKQIRGEARFLKDGIKVPNKKFDKPNNTKIDLLYVASMSIPHHTTGYATRTQSFLKAMRQNDVSLCCVTRPGYPWDRGDARHLDQIKLDEEIEGVRYRHVFETPLHKTPWLDYLNAAADKLTEVILEEKPKAVMAGSDYANGLPALIAARRTGTKFLYDMRGLWEFTAASKIKGWEYTDRFFVSRKAETLIASQADTTFAISSALREQMISRGVDGEKLQILPNSVDLSRFQVAETVGNKRVELSIPDDAIVFGFVGSIEPYEGTDDLLSSFKQVVDKGIDAYLLIVGDGSYSQHLGDLAAAMDIAKRIRLPGRVPFTEVLPYCESCDVFVYPRKKSTVTDMVPALKPLEAMAISRPVILSDVRALVELVGGLDNAVFFAAEDCEALTQSMLRLAQDVELRGKLGSAGKSFVYSQRDWKVTVNKVIEVI